MTSSNGIHFCAVLWRFSAQSGVTAPTLCNMVAFSAQSLIFVA